MGGVPVYNVSECHLGVTEIVQLRFFFLSHISLAGAVPFNMVSPLQLSFFNRKVHQQLGSKTNTPFDIVSFKKRKERKASDKFKIH